MKDYRYNSEYKSEVSKYTKKDAVIALCFYAFFIAQSITYGILLRFFELPFTANILFGVLTIVVCLAIVFIRKDGLASLGIRYKNFWLSLRLGLLFGVAPITLYSFTLGLVFGLELRPIGAIMFFVVHLIMFAFAEDILFVGYIQTRIYGLIKKDIWAIGFVALLFTLMHFPILIVRGVALDGGFLGASLAFFSSFFAHFVFNSVFRRYLVLLPVTIIHTVHNLNLTSGLWTVAPPFWVTILYPIIIAFVLIAWTFWLRRREDKAVAV